MAKEIMYFGASPSDVPCAQVGREGYEMQARLECRAYISQLKRVIASAGKEIPVGFRLYCKTEGHDLGSYLEVVVAYDPTCEESSNLAYWLDQNIPEYWDACASQELLDARYA